MNDDLGGVAAAVKAIWERGGRLEVGHRTALASPRKGGDGGADLVDDVDELPTGVEREVARPLAGADLAVGHVVGHQLCTLDIDPIDHHLVDAEVAGEDEGAGGI